MTEFVICCLHVANKLQKSKPDRKAWIVGAENAHIVVHKFKTSGRENE